MKILSIRQPWAWLIAHGIKDIENRDWTTRYRGNILIHAGKQFEDNAVHWILNRLSADERKQFPMHKSAFACGGIVGVTRLIDVVTDSDNKWFIGDYGWCFRGSIALPLIPLRGQLGLFDASSEMVMQVSEILKAEKEA